MPACPFCGLGGKWGRPAHQLRVRGRPAPPQTRCVCGQRLTVNHRARPSRGPDVNGDLGCDPSQGRLRREGCRGASGGAPRGTEPAARSGASGNGLSLSSRLSHLETQLSCTGGQRGRTPWPASPTGISAHRAVPSPAWSGQHQRVVGVGRPFIFMPLHFNTIRLRQQTSFLRQTDSWTLSLQRGFHNSSWVASE